MSDGITIEEFEKLKPRCGCPCNQLIPWKERYKKYGVPMYLKGHYFNVRNPTKGTKRPIELCNKISNANKGRVPWNKGKKMSKESKRKMSESKIGKPSHRKGKHHTEEARRKMSVTRKGRISNFKGKKHTEKSRQKMRESLFGRKLTDEHKHKISDNAKVNPSFGMKGKHHTDKTKSILSEVNKGRKPPPIKHFLYKTRNNLIITLRSGWEVEFAKQLDLSSEEWLYESKTFDLGNTTYTPDFYLPRRELFVEIKGRWREENKLKFERFLKLYPLVNIILLRKPPYNINNILNISTKTNIIIQ